MLNYIKRKVIGSFSDKELKKYKPVLTAVNAFEEKVRDLTQEQCMQRVSELKDKIKEGISLDEILPEAFSLVRKAAQETLGERHYDVQILGGIALHRGEIAEMKTGEGKTLASTLPLFLNALTGKGVHLVTVNDYLAERDAKWMGQVYSYLGLTVGVIKHNLNDEERRKAYHADITYGTNNEIGFDYLRDNMKFDLADYVQREHHYAIVDEVDSILIDEARTPLIISGPASDSTENYHIVDKEMYGLSREWRVCDNPEPELVAKHLKI
ncbi:preprotein translocase subunit SecA, partial [bacterium]|nr:preprotein translocase subunit SecA [bacterium]